MGKGVKWARRWKKWFFGGRPPPLPPSPMWQTPVLNHPQYPCKQFYWLVNHLREKARTRRQFKWVVSGITGHPVYILYRCNRSIRDRLGRFRFLGQCVVSWMFKVADSFHTTLVDSSFCIVKAVLQNKVILFSLLKFETFNICQWELATAFYVQQLHKNGNFR